MPPRRLAGMLSTAVLLVAWAPGCGSDQTQRDDVPAPEAASFPRPEGRTLTELSRVEVREDLSEQLVFQPGSLVIRPGRSRFSFTFYELDGSPAREVGEVAIYVAAPGEPAAGPFPAESLSMETESAFRSATAEAEGKPPLLWVARGVPFPRPGEARVMALLRREDGYYAVGPNSVDVRRYGRIPAAGERAVSVSTPTLSEVAQPGAICTRQPPGGMHAQSLDQVLGERPVALLFATPALCQTRVCGPVVDILEQLRAREFAGSGIAFIHQEIYEDNVPRDRAGNPVDPHLATPARESLAAPVRAWGLPTEPWLFVIDRGGTIRTAIEGAFGVEEARRALQAVAGEPRS